MVEVAKAPLERNPKPVQASASELIVPPRIEATPEDQQLGNIELPLEGPVLGNEGQPHGVRPSGGHCSIYLS
jgi:hypothetical protein